MIPYVDVHYLRQEKLIACALLETDAGLVLVDPGPGVVMPQLLVGLEARGASLKDVHAILLTHIHLDHAGTTGALVIAQPHIQVYVHTRGAPHLINPTRLMNSVHRLYGDQTDRLWGTFMPVPKDNVHALSGGERLTLGGHTFVTAYTPGHAVHHLSYLHEPTGTCFAGDVCGMRVDQEPYIFPVAPPPDIHLGLWHESLDRVAAWQPERLFLTHFAGCDDVGWHLDTLRTNLDRWGQWVRDALTEDPDDDPALALAYEAMVLKEIKRTVSEPVYRAFKNFGQPYASFHGIARYWRKRAAQHD